jgi:hypothetical protein
MSEKVTLNSMQGELLRRFYIGKNQQIVLNKGERKKLWDQFIKEKEIDRYTYLQKLAPAIFEEMKKSIKGQNNIQPAVFSECVYAQALADKFNLSVFNNHIDDFENEFEKEITEMYKELSLTVRYSYTRSDKSISLVQAGGAGGVDCALVVKNKPEVGMIELKEPYARTSEPNLPRYGEDGYLVNSPVFEKKYPQFASMYEEQLKKRLNVFEHIGSNIHDFSTESLEKAVDENYSGHKIAHVICTEDDFGNLVMIPANDVTKWATLEGEIRPSGRNHYKVWTPQQLIKSIEDIGGVVNKNRATVSADRLKSARERGGDRLSRFKINALFFVRPIDVDFRKDEAIFDLAKVRQLIPSITAKMKFENLDIEQVKKYYLDLL